MKISTLGLEVLHVVLHHGVDLGLETLEEDVLFQADIVLEGIILEEREDAAKDVDVVVDIELT